MPKVLRDALAFLATEDKVNTLVYSLTEELSHFNTSDDHDFLDQDINLDGAPEIAWTEGTEEYKDTPPDELWAMLGRQEKSVPFFNSKQDADNRQDPWSSEGMVWLQDPANGVPFTLRWHQLVGVLKMIENAFSKKPVLLMDGVGLGKTIQLAAYIAFLAWYRDFFTVHGNFPGKFGLYSLFLRIIFCLTRSFQPTRNGALLVATFLICPLLSLSLQISLTR